MHRGFPLSHLGLGPRHSSGCTPLASGMQTPSGITWTSHDNHATTCHLCNLISRSLSWQAWDLRVPPNPLYFQSISILLCANTSFLALQWVYVCLFSFLNQRPIVCAPVPCSHPIPFTSMQTAMLVTDTLWPPSQ